MKNRKQLVSIAVVLLLVIAMFFFMRKEPYITPESTCMKRDAPDWCPDEFSIAYSSSATSENDFSFYNKDTGLCSNGTRDCVYVEKYDNNRILQGIFNSENVELSQKFLDDVYSDKITFSTDMISEIREILKFENGIMKLKLADATFTVKVGMPTSEDERQRLEQQGIVFVPPSMFLVYVAIYFRYNNLPKPTIKYELKSETNLSQYRSSLPSATVYDSSPPSDGSSYPQPELQPSYPQPELQQ